MLRVHNSGHPSVKPGDLIPLVWEGMNFKVNVRFSSKVLETVGNEPAQRKMPAPWLLNGLDNVSALGSLAFHRDPYGDGDPFYVKLKAPTFDATARVLKTRSEPVQISGSHVALVKFAKVECDGADVGTAASVAPQSRCKIDALHYNPQTANFDVPAVGFEARTSTVRPGVGESGRVVRMSFLRDIEKQDLNQMGWYAYGFPLPGGGFRVMSLEPRQAMRVVDRTMNMNPFLSFVDGRRALEWVKEGQWEENYLQRNAGKGMVASTIFGDTAHQPETLAPWRQNRGEQRFLVLNIFGWWRQDRVLERDSLLRSGHFSMGTAKIVKDKFDPAEERLEIEYLQVYGGNNEDVAAGTMSWEHYMGNLQRGWMYLRPVSDVMVRVPEFDTSYFKAEAGMGAPVRPMDVIEAKTQYVMAAFRVGANARNDKGGTADGLARITSANSCAQDSTLAMFIALDTLFNPDVNLDPDVVKFRAWAKDNSGDALARNWAKAAAIYDSPRFGFGARMSFNDYMFRVWLGMDARSGWVLNRDEVAKPEPRHWQRANDDIFGEIQSAFGSLRSVFPASVHQRMSEIFFEHGAQFWVIQPLQIGGAVPGLSPEAPTRVPAAVR